ncbi:MAG: hypothetical protein IKU78_02430 [Paludibacteraceae bacterium]|nr:hypothetical protein [Paludibacteraceae bacterium]
MDRKKKFVLCIVQLCIVTFFTVLALGSASSKNGSSVSSREAASFINSFSEGFACGANGFVQVGSASSESGCKSLCENRGYDGAYCFSRTSGGCFCK